LHAASSSIETVLDDKSVPRVGHDVRVPYKTGQVLFRIGDGPVGSGKNTRRIRFKLEGVDSDWHFREGYMAFLVRFYNAAGDQVSQEEFRATGISPGWNQTIEKSTFTQRRELITVPPGATEVFAAVSSAGPPTSIGAYVVGDVVISKTDPAGNSTILLENATFLRMGSATPLASIWIPDGSHPSMAGTITFASRQDPQKAFIIIDDDPTAHAEWHSIKEEGPKVKPGEKLTVEWKELFTVGTGDLVEIGYAKPPEGRYRFRTEELDTYGAPTGKGDWVDITVEVPYWKALWFQLSITGAALVLLGGGLFFLFKWMVNRRLERLRQQHLLEIERLRIARNIHDDLGARLTQISLVSALAAKDKPENANDSFNKITRMTRDLVSALYETVWTVDPENDHLDSLVSFLCQLVPNMCEPANIRCRLDADEMPRDIHVSSETRHNISLIVKEAVHNAVKYSEATEIQIRITYASTRFSVMIKDNGRGFLLDETKEDQPPAKPARVSGLANMRNRIKSIGGEITIHSKQGEGTTITFSVSIP
jgi:signal transduction histidine kinase